jgi:hypothetical protein
MGDPFEECGCCGVIIEAPEVVNVPSSNLVALGPGSWATNQPFRLINGRAIAITGQDLDEPWADGLTLESGVEGQMVSVALFPTAYTTPLALPGSDGSILWLPKTATSLTSERPSLTLGYAWALPIARRSDAHTVVFSPQMPMKL